MIGNIVRGALGLDKTVAGTPGGVTAALLNGAKRGLFCNEVGMDRCRTLPQPVTLLNMALTGSDIVARFHEVEDSYPLVSRELTLEEWGERSFGQRYVDNTMHLMAALQ